MYAPTDVILMSFLRRLYYSDITPLYESISAEVSKIIRLQLEYSTLKELLSDDKVSHSANFKGYQYRLTVNSISKSLEKAS